VFAVYHYRNIFEAKPVCQMFYYSFYILFLSEPPPSPTSLRVAHLTSRSAAIQWNQPQTSPVLAFGQPLSEVTHFILEYRHVGDPAGEHIVPNKITVSSVILIDRSTMRNAEKLFRKEAIFKVFK